MHSGQHHNFKSTNKDIIAYMGADFKFGNKSFRLIDELWRQDRPITWSQYKSLYSSYDYTPYELCYNRSDRSSWSTEQHKRYLFCKKTLMNTEEPFTCRAHSLC